MPSPQRQNGAADRLYGLPLDEFTPARNALAKETAKSGDRDVADSIKSLRKPSVAAWALNQLARRHRDDVQALVSAGEQLRKAQEDLLAGGDREAFREASSLEQQLVSKLAGLAVDIASEAGAGATEALGHRLSDTLRAAALDPAVAETLLAGRLVREQTASGVMGVPAAPGPTAPKRTAKAGAPKASTKAAAKAQERLRTAERELRDAEKAEASARKGGSRPRARRPGCASAPRRRSRDFGRPRPTSGRPSARSGKRARSARGWRGRPRSSAGVRTRHSPAGPGYHAPMLGRILRLIALKRLFDAFRNRRARR